MNLKSKPLTFGLLVILLVGIFAIGWFWARSNPAFFDSIFSGITGNSYTPDFSIDDQKKIIANTDNQIQNLVINNTGNLALLIDCKNNCNTTSTQTQPYHWIQYAESYYNTLVNADYDSELILEDLNKYSSSEFEWKLYQYGDILLNNLGRYPDLEKKYNEIATSIYSGENPNETKYTLFTEDNKPSEDLSAKYFFTKPAQIITTSTYLSTRINGLANAYSLTKSSTYKNYLSNSLNLLNDYTYLDEPVAADLPYFKNTTCNTVLSSVYSYKAIQDKAYLAYVDYLLVKDAFKNLLDEDYANLSISIKDPMSILGCLDAMQQLSIIDSQYASKYNKNYDYILSYLKKGQIIDLNPSSKYFGFVKTPLAVYDVNSSAWLIKIISAKINSETK